MNFVDDFGERREAGKNILKPLPIQAVKCRFTNGDCTGCPRNLGEQRSFAKIASSRELSDLNTIVDNTDMAGTDKVEAIT
jgi:hypothetical protein